VTSSIELAIFDIAGTLIEDHNEVADAFLEALGANDIEVAEEQIREWKGSSSKRQMIAHFVNASSVATVTSRWLDALTAIFASYSLPHSHLLASVGGLPELLQ
jgi:beta-phosphoglucomutase-like phosphatase (HAD superfamily)